MKVVQETLGLSSITIAADTYTSVLPQLARQSAEDVAALIRPAGQTPALPGRRRRAAGSGHSPEARRYGRPGVPPGREVTVMTSSSKPTALGQYLARRGFAPTPGNPAWLDRGTGQQTVRVLHEPGETTLLYCLDAHGVCLYEAVFSPGTPDAVIIAASKPHSARTSPRRPGPGPGRSRASGARTGGGGDPR